MHRSSWEMEVYARDYQVSRQQEAARQRRAYEAAPRGQESVNGFNLGAAGFLETVKRWLSSGDGGKAPRTDRGEASIIPVQPANALARGRPARPALSGRLAAPYADMVVIARAPKPEMAEVVEQPCGVGDC